MRRRVVIAGGTGFIGTFLQERLAARDYDIVVLTRHPKPDQGRVRCAQWDARSTGDWTGELDGADAIINLTGRSVNCRYNQQNRREILASRVESTRVLGEAIARSRDPPPLWLNMSTATIYKHTFDRPMDEATGIIEATPEAKDAFSIDVALAWEQTFNDAPTPATRKVAMRTAMVFAANDGGVYRTLRSLARWGLGGPIAGGHQFISWIHEEDYTRAVEWLIDHDLSGPVNLASPNPIPQGDMMRIILRERGMPFGMHTTGWMMEIAAFVHRTEAELIIKSRRVVPAKLQASGFEFHLPKMEDAVHEIEGRIRGGPSHFPSSLSGLNHTNSEYHREMVRRRRQSKV